MDDGLGTNGLPKPQGLYDAANERDSCGIGFVANLGGARSHSIIQQGIQILINLTHRGASGCDPVTGDGAGILIQIPHKFFARECATLGFALPAPGTYGIGMVFLPVEKHQRLLAEGILERVVHEEGLAVLGWRDTPIDANAIGRIARASQPYIEQIFIGGAPEMDQAALERKLYVVRKRVESEIAASDLRGKTFFHIPSLSCRTIVYKGLLLAPQIAHFYRELSDPEVRSALCLVHQRFSTNTFPTWPLAHPFRYLCHNGEINTLRGNVAWMHARQSVLESPLFGDDLKKLFPICVPGGSDSATLDNTVELLHLAGRDLPHVMAMLMPEAWASDPAMDPERRAFYEYHASLMEPWDGPAAIAFTDGRLIGVTLDRNGLRPARFLITHSGLVIMASETGVLPVPPEDVRLKGRLQPGRMLLVDTQEGRIVPDEEIKQRLARRRPYAEWLTQHQITLDQLPESPRWHPTDFDSMVRRQRAFGYTAEDLKMILTPMAVEGQEPVGSMGTDTPLACLSEQPQPLFNYFKQLFAQVTNPPIDPIREEMVMSLASFIGTERNVLDETPQHCHTLKLEHPILTNRDLEKLRRVSWGDFLAITLPMVYRVEGGEKELERALEGLCRRASLAIKDGYTLLILSDRGWDEDYAPIPSLLALTAVHNHLVRDETRTQVALIVESGEPREVMHFALLIGYGASAVNPYLAVETLEDLHRRGSFPGELTFDQALRNFKKAVNKGLLKVFSKMGISTLQSYRGAQIFEAVGLSRSLVEKYFSGTSSRIEGVDLAVLAREAALRHAHAFRPVTDSELDLAAGGNYHYRAQGEYHLVSPFTISKLQQAVRQSSSAAYREFAAHVNRHERQLCTLRGLLEIRPARQRAPLEEVEPVREIVKRFTTGAMSFGSISKEAHETLAVAMNRLGGRSNSGEGGEDEERFRPDADGAWRRSAIKQVASGRFGVTVNYLVNADDLQIKIAQGAKPGEGGQLPGHKVDAIIARVRHSIPGVQLISPPPHHDIYSIEDLAQLIWDLKNVNPQARISVKLVSEVGVGIVAAGVAKAHADVILISGHDGGTGASPLTAIKHSGVPWELGLSETQQVLVLNDLRGRVRLQVDGKMQTGRDVVIAALLGAEEFGFSTAPLISLGCLMMRKCHLNTCPVGIATQDPELRRRFAGQPEHLVNYFFYVAEEARELMAALGFRRFDEMVGRVDRLEMRPALDHWKARGLDYSAILYNPPVPERVARRSVTVQDHGLDRSLDYSLIDRARVAIERRTPVEFHLPIRNVHRAVGAMLSGEIARRYGSAGLPDDTIRFHFRGSAGQSFGAFLAKGVTLVLEGDANDYLGKGLSGGRITVYPERGSTFRPEENILVGNVALYGATSGEAYLNGAAGERFAVRNSGATAVVEAVGDHGCEYMTKGVVVVLGPTGRNFAAGMTGGIAYVLDETGEFAARCNRASVDLEPVHGADTEALRTLVTRHLEHTRSPQAAEILLDWDNILPRFVKVFPHEYQRALRESHPEERLQKRAEGCMDCGVPFCQSGCPLENVIPDFNDLVCRERWSAALRTLHSTNNFPELTGRVCPAPCEAVCVHGLHAAPVTIKLNEHSIIERAFQDGDVRPQPPLARSGKRVAVVGSGPAGLAAAQQLNRAGHSVTVFEKADRIGGLLRYGIPDFKLEKSVLDRRLEQLEAEGVQFLTGAHVGGNVPLEDLRRDFDAILLAGGAEQPRDLDVSGRELRGIRFALEFLTQQNRRMAGDKLDFCSEILATGKRIAILGGGDTGADCLGTALRQNACSVHQLEILPKPPGDNSHGEGGVREWSVSTTRFTGDERGNVRGLQAVRVGPPPDFEPVPGSELALDVDLVLLAMGFTGPAKNGLLAQLGVGFDERGNVATDDNHMTSVRGIFAAGDLRRGQSLVVWAIAEGRRAAAAIDRYFTGERGRT